jgi:3-methylcrotonyl-CoA carboxylase alpha subunit
VDANAWLDGAMNEVPVVTRIGSGVYRVELDGRAHVVHVAGPSNDRWLHWNGEVFRNDAAQDHAPRHGRQVSAETHQSLSAPMPSTVLRVMVQAGSHVCKGDTLLILEAMKMEMPVRAESDGTVRAVLCREGELVQPGAPLVQLD